MRHEEIARAIVHAAYQVHNALGPGLLESVYEHCMIEELGQAGVRVEAQNPSLWFISQESWSWAFGLT